MKNEQIFAVIETNILREQITYRGGGVEIDLTDFGYEGAKMTAYQNYLGGGMLSSIGNDCTIREWRDDATLCMIAEQLAMYYHEQTNQLHDEWSATTFEQVQNRPLKAY